MSALAPTLEAFFTERLVHQRQASPHTIAAYRDGWRLLLVFTHERTGKQPSELDLGDLDAALIAVFLEHLETTRRNSVRTRNARLAAIRSFFRFAASAPSRARRPHRPRACHPDQTLRAGSGLVPQRLRRRRPRGQP